MVDVIFCQVSEIEKKTFSETECTCVFWLPRQSCLILYFMPLPVISHWKHFVLMLSSVLVCTAPMCDHILKVCQHDVLQTSCEKFTGAVGDKDELIRLHFEVKKSRSQQAQMHFFSGGMPVNVLPLNMKPVDH